MDSKGEIMLTIMASLAQQESQSLSQNVKLGLQYRYQQGEIQINCARFLGYTKNESKKLIIVPEEAEVVKRIYREYLEGARKMQLESANRDELKKRMADMSTFLKKQSTALTEYDEQLVRRLIEKVTIYEDKFTVEFKSGVTVDVE